MKSLLDQIEEIASGMTGVKMHVSYDKVTNEITIRPETPEEEIERLHKQDGKGDAPPYFCLSEAGL